ncbi:hypothetical protein DP107_07830 [Haloglomus irregulare]|jgi:hypothetical protein|uniref:Uncharacterized protein n=1 Tax=Haloglomus irregulare TaxID=2234134 RepID=A0A554NBU2_9EURY|nr:hypothetical protein [Haloglomus irregulare]TSD14856.1 hypothetical protein DP107_07830 [Haloglomus irregulare]
MTVEVQFSERLSERVGTSGAYVSVDGETTVAEVVASLSVEFGAEQLAAGTTAVRESAVGSESLSARSTVTPGDRLRLVEGA